MSERCLAPLLFDSAALPEAEQFRTYASGIPNFAVSRAGSGAFAMRARMWRVGGMVMARLRADPASYERTPTQVAVDDTDHFYLNYQIDGHVRIERSDGTIATGGKGSLAVLDMRQPCRMDVGRVQQLSLAIPRRLLAPALAGRDPHGLVVSEGLVKLFGPAMTAIERRLSSITPDQGDATERMVARMAADTLIDALDRCADRSRANAALVERAKAVMRARIAEPIGAQEIAQALAVSRSVLYRAFGGGSGVASELQRMRLEELRRRLDKPSDPRPVASLARELGFRDPSHCIRAFRQAFGRTPGQYREDRRSEQSFRLDPPRSEASATFRRWVTTLD